jgi:hypothetical protein
MQYDVLTWHKLSEYCNMYKTIRCMHVQHTKLMKYECMLHIEAETVQDKAAFETSLELFAQAT